MNTRQLEIIKTIKYSNEKFNSKALALRFNISQRTIQNDISELNYELSKISKNIGIYLDKNGFYTIVSPDNNDKIIERLIEKYGVVNISLKPEERIRYLFYYLCFKQGYTTIQNLAEKMNVSYNTAHSLIKKFNEQTKDFNIQIISNIKYGVKLQGDEKQIRNHLINIHLESSKNNYLVLDGEIICNYIGCEYFDFWEDKKEAIFDVSMKYLSRSGTYTKDQSLQYILLCVELSLARSSLGRIIHNRQLIFESTISTNEFKFAFDMMEELCELLDQELYPDEVCWIANVISGINNPSHDVNSVDNYAEIQLVACNLINEISYKLNIKIDPDSTTYKNLIMHIQPAVFRIKNGIKIDNPLLDEVKEKYAAVYEAVNNSIHILEKYVYKKVSEAEIGYISIHFVPYYDFKVTNDTSSKNILIVCDSGIGTSVLLSSRIKEIYEINIVSVIPLYELKQRIKLLKVDYIISTVNIDPKIKVDAKIIRVNPFLNEKDIKELDSHFKKVNQNLSIDKDKFAAVVKRYAKTEYLEKMLQDLTEELNINFRCGKKKEDTIMLNDAMREEMIELDYPAKDWEDAVREAGRLLKDSGCIEDSYIDSMVQTVKRIGAYIVISKGIALPHSRSGKDAKKVGISFLRLKEPVCFGHKENDPVDLVFALSSIDSSSHLRALQDLSNLLSFKENVSKLRKIKSADEVMKMVDEVK